MTTIAAIDCPACGHPSDTHDPVAARYCAVTSAQATPSGTATSRGCICRGHTTGTNAALSTTGRFR